MMATSASMQPIERWLHALKPASWPKLLVPMLLGQAIGVAATGVFEWGGFAMGVACTVFGLAFIVLMNDWGDQRVDAIKRRMFRDGCAPKTIPDGILAAPHVLWAGIGAGLLTMATAFTGAVWLALPWLGLGTAAGMMLFMAYSLPPLRMNYRGGGELLEMAGVGAVLPWINAYMQSRIVVPDSSWPLLGFMLLSLASAIGSGLADEQSDRIGGKRTFVTCFGNRAARRVVEGLLWLGGAAWLVFAVGVAGAVGVGVVVPALLVLLWEGRILKAHSGAARTNAFRAQGVYKRHLHRAIWYSSVCLAALLVLARWLARGVTG